MNIKNKDWLRFKRNLLMLVEVFADDTAKITFPDFEDDNFALQVNDTPIRPVLVKTDTKFRVEYSFQLCQQISIRTLAFSMIEDAVSIEFTIKKEKMPCPVNPS